MSALAGSSGSLGFERRSTIGLSNNSWGEIRLGRDYTPSYNIFTAFAGPDTTTGVQANLFQTIRQTAYNAASQSGVVDRTRISNAVGYFLPSDLGGVYGQFSVSFGDENASGSGASKARRYIGGNLGYRSGPLNVGIGYGRIDGTAAVASPSAIAATSDLEDLVLGASYNFGSFLLNGGYNSLKWEPRQRRNLREGGRFLPGRNHSHGARQLARQVRQRQVQRQRLCPHAQRRQGRQIFDRICLRLLQAHLSVRRGWRASTTRTAPASA